MEDRFNSRWHTGRTWQASAERMNGWVNMLMRYPNPMCRQHCSVTGNQVLWGQRVHWYWRALDHPPAPGLQASPQRLRSKKPATGACPLAPELEHGPPVCWTSTNRRVRLSQPNDIQLSAYSSKYTDLLWTALLTAVHQHGGENQGLDSGCWEEELVAAQGKSEATEHTELHPQVLVWPPH